MNIEGLAGQWRGECWRGEVSGKMKRRENKEVKRSWRREGWNREFW